MKLNTSIMKNKEPKLHLFTHRTFKAVAIGESFEFDSVTEFPVSGMERGPWVKTGSRTYEKPGMKCRVGSINTGVYLVF